MADPRYQEALDPMPAEPGKWIYGKSFLPMLEGRIPVAAPGGLATLGPDGKLVPEQLGNPGQFVPTRIAAGQTFVIPADTQALYVLPITLDAGAALLVEGHLLEIVR